jgi:tRNA splicing endonuclease
MVHVEKEEEEEEEGVDMLTLVGGGRVATQTRKAWMLAGQVDGHVRVFSIEWAGFG